MGQLVTRLSSSEQRHQARSWDQHYRRLSVLVQLAQTSSEHGGLHGGPKVAKGDALGKDVLRTPSSSSLSIMLLQSLLAMSVIDLPLLRVYERFVCCITQPQSLGTVDSHT